MWQPTGTQRWFIWIVAIFLLLAWPPAEGGSLAVKAVRWTADPRNKLPVLPDPLPMGLGDDGLPVSLQVLGARCDDARVLAAAHTIEQVIGVGARPTAATR